MAFKTLIALTVFASIQCRVFAATSDPPPPPHNPRFLPVTIGDVKIVDGKSLHRSGIVVDDKGTAYLLSILANGENRLLRLSRRGIVKELIMYRGWPYIVTKNHRLYALDTTLANAMRTRIPYITMRAIKTSPIAVGVGLGVYAVALLDQTLTGIISVENFDPNNAFWAGFLTYYGLDIAHTLFMTSHRLTKGGDFFTKQLLKHVIDIGPDSDFDDYKIIHKTKENDRNVSFLSKLAPARAGKNTCIDFLIKMNLR